MMEAAANKLNIDPDLLRRQHLHSPGATWLDCKMDCVYQKQVWDECCSMSNFEERKKEIAEFNANHRWVKRGLGKDQSNSHCTHNYYIFGIFVQVFFKSKNCK